MAEEQQQRSVQRKSWSEYVCTINDYDDRAVSIHVGISTYLVIEVSFLMVRQAARKTQATDRIVHTDGPYPYALRSMTK